VIENAAEKDEIELADGLNGQVRHVDVHHFYLGGKMSASEVEGSSISPTLIRPQKVIRRKHAPGSAFFGLN
jgi:hypothetical protein